MCLHVSVRPTPFSPRRLVQNPLLLRPSQCVCVCVYVCPSPRRLVQNPSYYDLADTSSDILSEYLSALIEDTLGALEAAGCVELSEPGGGGDTQEEIVPTKAGR